MMQLPACTLGMTACTWTAIQNCLRNALLAPWSADTQNQVDASTTGQLQRGVPEGTRPQ